MKTPWSIVLFFALGAVGGAASAQDPVPPVEEAPPPSSSPGEEGAGAGPTPPEGPPGRVEAKLTPARVAVASPRIDVDAESERLEQVLARISRAAGVPVLTAPEVQEALTVSLREIPWREAVDVIARMVRCEVVDLPGGGALLTPPVLVDLEVDDGDLRGALQLIARVAGRSLVLGNDVHGRVSVSLKEVPWRDALAIVARGAGGGLQVVEGAGYVMVGTTPPPELGDPSPSLEELAELGATCVDVVAVRADPVDVAEAIGRLVDRSVLVDPSVRGRVDLDLTGAPWGLAVGLLARELGCDIEVRDNGAVILVARPRCVIQAVGAPAVPMIRLLASYAGWSVVVGPSVGELVTFDLRGVHYLVALRLTAWAHGWSVVEDSENSLVVTAGAARAELPLPMTAYDAQVDQLVGDIVRLARDRRPEELDVHLDALRRLVARASGRVEPPAPTPERERELRDLRFDLADLVGQLRWQTPDDRVATLDALGRALAEGGAAAQATLRALLVEEEPRLRKLPRETWEGLRLQLELHAGALVLDAMTEALEREDGQAALEAYARLDAVLARMRAEEGEAFHRNAKVVDQRARLLADRATLLATIAARFGALLHVQAIVYTDPDGSEPDSAVISGAILREGDTLVDPTTGESIEGLRVVEIDPGRVRFRFEDTEFSRAIGVAPH